MVPISFFHGYFRETTVIVKKRIADEKLAFISVMIYSEVLKNTKHEIAKITYVQGKFMFFKLPVFQARQLFGQVY